MKLLLTLLGELSGLHEFHGILRRDLDPSFEYEDVTVYEPFDSDAFPRSPKRDTSDTSAPGGNFSIQANECTDMTSCERMLCENMPSWHWFWGAGGVLAFYYSPRLLANFVNDAGAAIKAGKDLRNIWRDGTVGTQQGLVQETAKREDAIDYHFTLPHILTAKGEPDPSVLSKRSFEEDGLSVNITTLHDYVYSGRDETFYYKGTSPPRRAGSLHNPLRGASWVGPNPPRITRSTCLSGNCIGSVLEYHIHKSAETERFACRPMNNKGSWHATMWLMINHGQGNLGTYGYCC
ncbi:hypothetical protein QBC33DRAFT_589020 [Phialemonium atrogriseum]|uniref:Uncharacterized protein n=1 Tax=Phialemonium atrogriseum TaxID=1093897 RepID=A0AAJ0BZQ6_9PEZI|nr:uncharacterized protein QBC33DRAFT_589020 [Phialemonium atrogriseum]KAK1766099.1 hypothetical protein QBC33DRAFT_589020 [Phialemonium atrogriseum]